LVIIGSQFRTSAKGILIAENVLEEKSQLPLEFEPCTTMQIPRQASYQLSNSTITLNNVHYSIY